MYNIEKTQQNKARWLSINPYLTEHSGIYFLYRTDKNGIKYGYVGQARHLLSRLAGHLNGYVQHIDLSLRNHGLKSDINPSGWAVKFFECPEGELDEKEQAFIKQAAKQGYQLRNKTIGGQGKGKYSIEGEKPVKGYQDGLKKGKANTQKEIAHLFNLHLDYLIKGKPTKLKEKAYQKFSDFLAGVKHDGD